MLQHELEERIGRKVSDVDYARLNAMYALAGDDIDKDVFCADYVKHEDSILMKAYFEALSRALSMKKQSDMLRERGEERLREYALGIIDKAYELDDKGLRGIAVQMIGERAVVKYVIGNEYELMEDDKAFLKSIL